MQKADSYITVEVQGVELKFYKKDIKEIIAIEGEQAIAGDKYAQFEKKALIEKVLELSNIKKQVEYMPLRVSEEYSQHKLRIRPEMYEAGSKIMLAAYNEKSLYYSITDYFSKNFNRAYLLEIKDFLESPLCRKIIELEDKVSNVESVDKIKEFGDGLVKNPPSDKRAELIKKLDEVVGATDIQIETVVSMYKGIAFAIDPVVIEDKRLHLGELDRLAEEMRKQLRNILKDVMSVSFLYTYRSLPDEQLQQYIDFWSSDAGKWFNRVSDEAFVSVMDKASKQARVEFDKLANNPQNVKELIKPLDVMPKRLNN